MVLALITVNFVLFGRSLRGYFYADDFVHVSYLFDVFSGHWPRLWENFTGNWMQANGTQFYRPLITLTLVLDYWLGNGKATAFHFSNIVYQTGCSVFLFLSCRRLLSEFSSTRATVTAMVAALLFAVYPLHCEVVNWVIGRVDSVCLFFFLCSTWLYLRYRQTGGKWSMAGALCAFALSLMSKEPAVILPPLLVLFEVVLHKPKLDGAPQSFVARAIEVVKFTAPYWLTLLLYLVVRTFALGTLIGGYGGSVGDGFNQSIFHRLFADGSAQRILFPLNAAMFPPGDKTQRALGLVYSLGLGTFLIRSLIHRDGARTVRYVGLSLGWLVLAMLPVIQVFNITDTLQCSRFAYAATAPLCLLMALLLMYPGEATAKAIVGSRRVKSVSLIAGSLLALVLVCLLGSIACRNNRPWSAAAEQVKQYRAQVEDAARKLMPNEKLVVLNVPDRLQGAHMIYNGAMLSVLMSPPLTNPGVNDKVISFEPINFGDSNLVDFARLRKEISNKRPVYWWDMTRLQLIPLAFSSEMNNSPKSSEPGVVQAFQKVKNGFIAPEKTIRTMSPVLNVHAASVDIIRCKIKAETSTPGSSAVAQLYWTGETSPQFTPSNSIAVPLHTDGTAHEYAFPVFQYKNWWKERSIKRLCLEISGRDAAGQPLIVDNIEITTLELASASNSMPLLRADERIPVGNDGVHQIGAHKVQLAYDSSYMPSISGCFLEISRPNSWFEHYTGNLVDTKWSSRSLKKLKMDGVTGAVTLSADDFPQSGFYQIRLGASDASGALIGFTSVPVNVQVSK